MGIPTAEQLMAWRADPVLWARENLYIQSPTTGILGLMEFVPHQEDWIREATRRDSEGNFVYKIAVACWPKRDGKTNCVVVVCLWRTFIFGFNQHIGILANSEKQSMGNIYCAMQDIIINSPSLNEYVKHDALHKAGFRVEGVNNSCLCYANQYRTIQGKKFDVLAGDELHAMDDGGKAWNFASSQTEAKNAQALVCSQAGPDVETNPMWRLHGARDESHVFFDYRTEASTPWSLAMREHTRKTLHPDEWRYQWENKWGAGKNVYFESEILTPAFRDIPEILSPQEWELLRHQLMPDCIRTKIGVGLDRGGKMSQVKKEGSRSVWTVAAGLYGRGKPPIHVILRQVIFEEGSEEEILIEERITRHIFGSHRKIILEEYGCVDLQDKIRGADIQKMSDATAVKLFQRTRSLLCDKRLLIPARMTELRREMSLFEWLYKGEDYRNTFPKFGVQREKDDTVYSMVWALEACDAPIIQSSSASKLRAVEPTKDSQELLAALVRS